MAEDIKDTTTENIPILYVSTSPHLRDKDSVSNIMWAVNMALLPAAIGSIYFFGLRALYIILLTTLTAVITEFIIQRWRRQPVSITDGSAVITGILLAFNVPPGIPLWLPPLGAVFGVTVAKHLFGGLGYNIFNPALIGRAFLMAAYPVQMTATWLGVRGAEYKSIPTVILKSNLAHSIVDKHQQIIDSISSATPLAALKTVSEKKLFTTVPGLLSSLCDKDLLSKLFLGSVGGCIGETSVILLLIGAIYLLARKIITWHIPSAYIGTVTLLALTVQIIKGYPATYFIYHLLAGGLVLGAFFMATDMVTSPLTPKGGIIFGIGCGILTIAIRLFGGYPEGVSYSILLMNAATPVIDRHTRPQTFGKKGKKDKKEK